MHSDINREIFREEAGDIYCIIMKRHIREGGWQHLMNKVALLAFGKRPILNKCLHRSYLLQTSYNEERLAMVFLYLSIKRASPKMGTLSALNTKIKKNENLCYSLTTTGHPSSHFNCSIISLERPRSLAS